MREALGRERWRERGEKREKREHHHRNGFFFAFSTSSSTSSKKNSLSQIRVTPPPGKRLEHAGIKVRLIGRVELPSDRGGKHEFVSLVRDLSPPGELGAPATYRFDFGRVELPYESYSGGGAARLTYAVRASVKRPYGGSTAREWGLAVRNAREHPPVPTAAEEGANTSATANASNAADAISPSPIKMEVGIEDCLHIEFEYDKAAYHLSDVVRGRISFLLVRIRLKHMELEVRRRETSGAGANARSEATTLCKYEIMDGAPVRGETVPIRLCLAPYDLTPTYLNVHNKVRGVWGAGAFFFFFVRVFVFHDLSHSRSRPLKKKLSSPRATSSTSSSSTRRTGATSSSRRSRCGGRRARTRGLAGEGPGAASAVAEAALARLARAVLLLLLPLLPRHLALLLLLLLLPSLSPRRRRLQRSRRSSCRGRSWCLRRRRRRSQQQRRKQKKRSEKRRRRRRLRRRQQHKSSKRRPRRRRRLEFFFSETTTGATLV